jgi:uncharacterized protein (TIGR02466 family)
MGMAKTREIGNGFLELWPTIFVNRRLDNAASHNAALLTLIEGLEAARANLTTDYLGSDFFNMDHPAVNWLRGELNSTVMAYLRHIGIGYSVKWTIQGWPNVNRFGDYHDPHNHPRAYLSGTYYVKMPEHPEALQTRSDVRPGCISFYDPRTGINMDAIRDDPYIDPEYTVRPEPGLLLMWPGLLHHFVHPNLSRETRVSVSFNIVLRWSDDYLPDQR